MRLTISRISHGKPAGASGIDAAARAARGRHDRGLLRL